MIHLYICLNDKKIDENLINKASSLVSEQRRKKAFKYHNIVDRKNALVVEVMLRKILEKYYDIKDFEIAYTDNGKPYLVNKEQIFFNISHTKGGAVVVCSDREIGVDIQDIKDVNEGLLKRVCNEEERKIINGSSEEFTRIWTMKEAYIKRCGGRLFEVIDVDTNKIKKECISKRINDLYLTICTKEIEKEEIIEEYFILEDEIC